MKKKFIEIAKESNLYTLQNLPQEALKDTYFMGNLEWYKERYNKVKIPEGIKNIQDIEVGVFAEVKPQYKNNSNEIELYYIENFYTLVFINDNVYILVFRKDKYSLFPIYRIVNLLSKDINSSQKYEFTKKIVEPNRIGVFTIKKLQDWAKYCEDYTQAIKDANFAVNSKLNENQKKIDNFISSLNGKCEVKQFRNYTIVNTKYFEVEFELLDNGAYLNEKIYYKGGLNGGLSGIIEIEA
jgi:hypothetical protein